MTKSKVSWKKNIKILVFNFGEARSLIVIFGGSSKYVLQICLLKANKI
jgi:hypothetical protein